LKEVPNGVEKLQIVMLVAGGGGMLEEGERCGHGKIRGWDSQPATLPVPVEV
jgi:hypothetical protein